MPGFNKLLIRPIRTHLSFVHPMSPDVVFDRMVLASKGNGHGPRGYCRHLNDVAAESLTRAAERSTAQVVAARTRGRFCQFDNVCNEEIARHYLRVGICDLIE